MTFAAAEAGYLVSASATRPIMVHHIRIFAENADSEISRLIKQPIADAFTLPGPPDIESENALVYYCGEVNSIKIEVADGAVFAIIWQPYTG